MRKLIRITALVTAIFLVSLALVACIEKAEEPDTQLPETQKYTVTLVANEVPSFVAEKMVKSTNVHDSVGNSLGFVTDILCESSISYASKDGKLVATDKMGYKSIILTTVVDAYETLEGWYIGDTLYGIGHTDIFHVGNTEAELTVRTFEILE